MDVLSKSTKMQRTLAAIISIGAFLILWYIATTFTGLSSIMPDPVTVIGRFIRGLYTKIGAYTILGHAAWSLSRVLIAYSVAAVVGIILGLAMGWSKGVEAFCRPIFEMIRPIPPIAWIPLSILWLGLGEMTKYFLIFLAAFSNVTMNAYAGALAVDPVLVGAARMLGANKLQIFTKIVIPSSVPQIFAGLQIALSSSWATVVAAEMVRSSEGIGWMIFAGMETNNMPQILVGILAIGLIGFLLAIIMRGAESYLCAWNNKGV